MPKIIPYKKTILRGYHKLKNSFTNSYISELYDISVRTLYNIRHTAYEELNDYKVKRVSFMHKLSDAIINFVIDNTVNNCYFSVKKIIRMVGDSYKIKLTSRQVYIILDTNNITYKRVTGNNKYRKRKNIGEEDILNKKKEVKEAKNVIFIDEVHVDLADVRPYGWSPEGEPVRYDVSIPQKIINKRISIIAAVSRNRKVYYKVVKGSVNRFTFAEFANYLRKKTRIKKYYMDNASIHKSGLVRSTLNDSNITTIYGLPYTPELNIIENFFRSFKSKLRSEDLKDRVNVEKYIDKCWNDVPISVLKNTYSSVYN